MQWEDREESSNVEDRRGMSGRTMAVGGGAGGLVILLIAMFLGVDPRKLAEVAQPGGPQDGPPAATQHQETPEEARQAKFTRVILRDTEIVWNDLFRRAGRQYREPHLVLFTDRVDSACGMADSAVGPFYCPGDSKVYIDLGFYRDMEKQLNAPGEFARAYVIAHEVGHHVQNLLGFSQRVHEARQRSNKVEANNMSVRLELQADFLAGVWAHHAQKRFKFLEPGDIDSALKAAFEIGDDRLQRKSRGVVVPDSFTHGTSKQRQRWFMEGFRNGDLKEAQALFSLAYGEL